MGWSLGLPSLGIHKSSWLWPGRQNPQLLRCSCLENLCSWRIWNMGGISRLGDTVTAAEFVECIDCMGCSSRWMAHAPFGYCLICDIYATFSISINKCYGNDFHHNLHIAMLPRNCAGYFLWFCYTVFFFEKFTGVTEDVGLSSAHLNDSFSVASTVTVAEIIIHRFLVIFVMQLASSHVHQYYSCFVKLVHHRRKEHDAQLAS